VSNLSNIPFLKKAGQATFVDRHVKKFGELVHDWCCQKERGFVLIGAPLSKSSISHSGATFSPGVIRQQLQAYSTYAIEEERDVDAYIYDAGDIEMHVTNIVESQQRIANVVEEVTKKHPLCIPIVLGGDHSISYPSITGFAKNKKTVGVIQFDAHHDLRNLEDGGPSNGTPFRSLLESGVIKGEHLVQIGLRNFSNSKAYHDYAKEHGVTVYTMKDVRERKIEDIIEESVAYLKGKVDVIYISVDMDVLDQAFAPGCPAIGPGGMTSDDVLQAIRLLAKEEIVQGMDIVEIDPTLDFRNMTSRLAAHIMMEFVLHKKGWD
jgi:formiminoglutamase